LVFVSSLRIGDVEGIGISGSHPCSNGKAGDVTLTTSKRLPTRPESRIRVVSGLHGHGIGVDVPRSFTAELIGTFVRVLAIISTAIAAALAEPVAGASFNSLAVPIADGFALVVAVLGAKSD
jgi:hypothetical protein